MLRLTRSSVGFPDSVQTEIYKVGATRSAISGDSKSPSTCFKGWVETRSSNLEGIMSAYIKMRMYIRTYFYISPHAFSIIVCLNVSPLCLPLWLSFSLFLTLSLYLSGHLSLSLSLSLSLNTFNNHLSQEKCRIPGRSRFEFRFSFRFSPKLPTEALFADSSRVLAPSRFPPKLFRVPPLGSPRLPQEALFADSSRAFCPSQAPFPK